MVINHSLERLWYWTQSEISSPYLTSSTCDLTWKCRVWPRKLHQHITVQYLPKINIANCYTRLETSYLQTLEQNSTRQSLRFPLYKLWLCNIGKPSVTIPSYIYAVAALSFLGVRGRYNVAGIQACLHSGWIVPGRYSRSNPTRIWSLDTRANVFISQKRQSCCLYSEITRFPGAGSMLAR